MYLKRLRWAGSRAAQAEHEAAVKATKKRPKKKKRKRQRSKSQYIDSLTREYLDIFK